MHGFQRKNLLLVGGSLYFSVVFAVLEHSVLERKYALLFHDDFVLLLLRKGVWLSSPNLMPEARAHVSKVGVESGYTHTLRASANYVPTHRGAAIIVPSIIIWIATSNQLGKSGQLDWSALSRLHRWSQRIISTNYYTHSALSHCLHIWSTDADHRKPYELQVLTIK